MPRLPRVRMACWFSTGGTGTAPAGRPGEDNGVGSEADAGETGAPAGGGVAEPEAAVGREVMQWGCRLG
jgi:hypothetical protein